MVHPTSEAISKEYVGSLIGLYKNNGAASCVGNYFNFNIPPAPWCTTRCTPYFDTQMYGILQWADINRNYNIFFDHSEVWDAMPMI